MLERPVSWRRIQQAWNVSSSTESKWHPPNGTLIIIGFSFFFSQVFWFIDYNCICLIAIFFYKANVKKKPICQLKIRHGLWKNAWVTLTYKNCFIISSVSCACLNMNVLELLYILVYFQIILAAHQWPRWTKASLRGWRRESSVSICQTSQSLSSS